MKDNHFEILLDKDYGELKNLRVKNNSIYFVGSNSGKDVLYRFDLVNKSVSKVYEPRFGIESPAFSSDGRSLVLSDYTADGFRLIKIPQKDLNEVEIANPQNKNIYLPKIWQNRNQEFWILQLQIQVNINQENTEK
ncbi:MAG: hypothetical protein IPF54_21970 [Draconibacterium sp.]|nr:hypothetical protein [Draconibacterium sp.]